MNEDWIDALVWRMDGIRDSVNFSSVPELLKQKKVGARRYSAREIVYDGKVYQQGKRTVLKVGKDVFMSEPEKGEKYDAEKGLLICLIKAMGMNITDFLYLSKSAKNTTKKKSK